MDGTLVVGDLVVVVDSVEVLDVCDAVVSFSLVVVVVVDSVGVPCVSISYSSEPTLTLSSL